MTISIDRTGWRRCIKLSNKAFKKHDIVFFYNDRNYINEDGEIIKRVT
ncbi:MAG: hypothetical protein G5Z42_00665 [Caldisphaeraceae archaeon]|nr:hypothetical protein [Caldisphaeraceae archaeon]MEB3691441.1 hypothetical protein [Caldisphaeraceae archaeon]MEB3797315.1 hypothetical protein [Caldisphaeraceae archaeon]